MAAGWKTKRMGKVELAILRLAVYEMLYDNTIPEKVSVNEAVELAKKFGGNESPAFVNGVLAKFIPKEGAKEEAELAKEEIEFLALDNRRTPIRILEVGAGVGGTSVDVIPSLDGTGAEYYFTDLSAFFLNNARENY